MTYPDLTIDDILPHRGRIKLLERIIEVEADYAKTEATAHAGWPLVSRNHVSPLILMELTAQTAGICNGMERIKTNGMDSEKKGWIVGVKKAVFHIKKIEVGATILTHVENRFKYDTFREVLGWSTINGIKACEITLQVFQPEN